MSRIAKAVEITDGPGSTRELAVQAGWTPVKCPECPEFMVLPLEWRRSREILWWIVTATAVAVAAGLLVSVVGAIFVVFGAMGRGVIELLRHGARTATGGSASASSPGSARDGLRRERVHFVCFNCGARAEVWVKREPNWWEGPD